MDVDCAPDSIPAGEVAEIDTSTPHWFTSLGPRPAEVLALVGTQGERMRLRVRDRSGYRSLGPIAAGTPLSG